MANIQSTEQANVSSSSNSLSEDGRVYRIRGPRQNYTIFRVLEDVLQILHDDKMEIVSDVEGVEFDDVFVDAREVLPIDNSRASFVAHPNAVRSLSDHSRSRVNKSDQGVEQSLEMILELCSDQDHGSPDSVLKAESELDLSNFGSGSCEIIVDATQGIARLDGVHLAVSRATHILGSIGNDRYRFSAPVPNQHYVVRAGRGWNSIDLSQHAIDDVEIAGNKISVMVRGLVPTETFTFSIEFDSVHEIRLSEDVRIALVPLPGLGAV